jgi:hypothetical protein
MDDEDDYERDVEDPLEEIRGDLDYLESCQNKSAEGRHEDLRSSG